MKEQMAMDAIYECRNAAKKLFGELENVGEISFLEKLLCDEICLQASIALKKIA